MSKKWLYIFTRKDLSPSQIAVQSVHSAFEMGRFFPKEENHPSVVLIRMNDEDSLLKVEGFLKNININYKIFKEPYYGESITSICVEPITEDKRSLFKMFQLMRDSDFNKKEKY